MDYVVIALILVVLGYLFFGRPKPDVDGAAARALVKEGATLVDVRSPGEYAGGHLPDALNIPVGDLDKRIGELERQKEEGTAIVVYCESGMRSARAKKMLEQRGFGTVHDLGSRHRW